MSKHKPLSFTSRSYHLIFRFVDGVYCGSVKELPGCFSESNSATGAIYDLYDAMDSWIQAALELDQEIPEPEEECEMSENLFVITEVKAKEHWRAGQQLFCVVGDQHHNNELWIRSDSPALVREGQLRIGPPTSTDRYIDLEIKDIFNEDRIIIDPLAPVREKYALEKWADEVEGILNQTRPDPGWYEKLQRLMNRRPK